MKNYNECINKNISIFELYRIRAWAVGLKVAHEMTSGKKAILNLIDHRILIYILILIKDVI